MFKDQKDEMIVALKRKNAELEENLRFVQKQCDELKKGDTAAEAKIKALSEMHASKIKTLLKSIQNLKIEVQREKFEKKDNVRAKIIEGLKKEHEDFEVAINALRKVVNNEDKCDQAIKAELQKGPKRIRIASREELKMETKKYKNMSLRLLEIMKQAGIKPPAGFKIDQSAGTGLKDIKEENMIFDINDLDNRSNGGGQGEGADNKENTMRLNADLVGEQELIEANERYANQIVNLNQELREKNDKLLEQLEEIEDLNIQIYARDKSISLQQRQIEELLEELRDAKSIENDIKILVAKKISLEEENQRLRREIDSKFISNHERQSQQSDLVMENKRLTDEVKILNQKVSEEFTLSSQKMKKLEGEKATLMNDLVNSQKELEKAKKELADVKKSAGDISLKLQQVDSQTKGMVQSKEQDLEGFRKRVVELERESKEKDERLIKLEARVVELSTEVADKDYEIEFYSNSIEELQKEIDQLKLSSSKSTLKPVNGTNTVQGSTTEGTTMSGNAAAELEAWKKKCKMLQLSEVRYLEEIEQLKALKAAEDRERTVTNVVSRSRSKSKTREEIIAENDGIE